MCGNSCNLGMGTYPAQVRWNSTSPSQSAIGQWDWEFPHRAGRYRPGGSPFSSSVCWCRRCVQVLMIQGWGLMLPGWRWFYEPQVGFPHRGGRCRPGRPPFSTPVCRRCKCMEGSMILGFEFILPGWRWPYKPLKGPWLPVLLEEEDGCSELLIRCANTCLLYTSPSPRDLSTSRMPSSA